MPTTLLHSLALTPTHSSMLALGLLYFQSSLTSIMSALSYLPSLISLNRPFESDIT